MSQQDQMTVALIAAVVSLILLVAAVVSRGRR
jgi:hypothetical protein